LHGASFRSDALSWRLQRRVRHEPKITSTLSSVSKRRALAEPLPGSEASSEQNHGDYFHRQSVWEQLQLFSHRVCRNQNRDPVSDKLTPISISASAAGAADGSDGQGQQCFLQFHFCLLRGWVGKTLSEKLHFNRWALTDSVLMSAGTGMASDAIGIVGMLDAKGAHFCAFAQHCVAAHHHMFVNKMFCRATLAHWCEFAVFRHT